MKKSKKEILEKVEKVEVENTKPVTTENESVADAKIEQVEQTQETVKDISKDVEATEEKEIVKDISKDVEGKAKGTVVQQLADLQSKLADATIMHEELEVKYSSLEKFLTDEQNINASLNDKIKELETEKESLVKANDKLQRVVSLKAYGDVSEGTEPVGSVIENKSKYEVYQSLQGQERIEYFSKNKDEILKQRK